MSLVRAHRILFIVVLAAFASAPPAGTARATAAGQPRLPAPITVQTSAGTFELQRDGRATRVRSRVLAFPPGVSWYPGTGAWYVIRHRHLVIGQWRRALWRSHGEFPSWLDIGVVTTQAGIIAFSYRSHGSEQLYLARVGRPERRIARGEFPLGWTDGGLFTYRFQGRTLRFRSDVGVLESTVARHPASYEYDSRTQSLYFIARGQLIRAQGAATEPIASLRALGLKARPAPALLPAGGLVELLGSDRLILLGTDGSVFAQTRLALSWQNLSSEVALEPDGHAVAYTVLSGRQPASGIETVYVLRAGARAATALHRQRIQVACERGAAVQWHGHWLLYSTSEGNLAVLDSAGRHPAIELGPIVRSLPGHPHGISAYWTGLRR